MADELTEKIIGAAIEVHRILGPGMLESIYEEALCHELSLRGMRVARQAEVDVRYKNVVIKGQKLDLLVESQVIVELKSVSRLVSSELCFLTSGNAAWPTASNVSLCDLCVLCG
jgi:GxxExxY protein